MMVMNSYSIKNAVQKEKKWKDFKKRQERPKLITLLNVDSSGQSLMTNGSSGRDDKKFGVTAIRNLIARQPGWELELMSHDPFFSLLS